MKRNALHLYHWKGLSPCDKPVMPVSDEIPSSPPGPGASLEQSLKYYKAQYELLEAELADFQASSKDLEAELEKDIEASEKRERHLKEKAANLQYEVDEWKEKYKQSKNETGITQNKLQKEITDLRDQNRTLQLKLRDIEVANDDYERKQRNTESSLEDMQAQYDKSFEKTVMLEQEVQGIEQERETLRIDVQRLKDELQDFKIEAEITKEKLKKTEQDLERRNTGILINPLHSSLSPRVDLSPTTTNTSTPSFDTPPKKTTSASVLSDTATPPSPPISEKSAYSSKPLTTPNLNRSRVSINANSNITPRQSTQSSRPNGHTRGLSMAAKSSTYRQSLSRPPTAQNTAPGLPQSSSIMQLRNLRGKMQKLEQRVQNARSKLPAPVSTPPRLSPRPGSAFGQNAIPSSVTVRSRKRTTGSNITGPGSLPDNNSDAPSTPSIPRTRPSRQSLTQQFQSTTSPTRNPGSMLPPRPSSRTSGISSRQPGFVPSHSRPGSRASISNFRAPLGSGVGSQYAPNASTDRVRPSSSLSDYRKTTYDGNVDGDLDEAGEPGPEDDLPTTENPMTTPISRRTTLTRPRTSDIAGVSSIPTPLTTKRASLSGISRLPGPNLTRRQSNIGVSTRPESRTSMAGTSTGTHDANNARPPSRVLGNVNETYDLSETF